MTRLAFRFQGRSCWATRLACASLCLLAMPLPAQPGPAEGELVTDTHRIREVRNGIYLAQSTARVFNSNALVVVNEEDVVLVDSHITPQKARELVASVAELTPKPVVALINSHFHYDHAHGNQIFDGIPIIGHEYTRMKMAGAPLEEHTWKSNETRNKATLEKLQSDLAEMEDGEEKTAAQAYLDMFSAHVQDFDEVTPVPPDVTLTDRLTLIRGSREIQILFLGRAHTGGDVSVYFPQDKLVFTGDTAFGGPSYLADGFVDEWPQTLMNLKALDIDMFVPGHGDPVMDLGRLDLVAAYYEDLWAKTAAKHAAGVSAEEAAKTIDLTNHTEIPIMQVGVGLDTVQRIYFRIENPDAP